MADMDLLRAAVKTVLEGRLPPVDVTKTLISKASSAHTTPTRFCK
jgi:hypothetical protein